MLSKEHQEDIVGVFRDAEGIEEYTYSFRKITEEEYRVVEKGEAASSDCYRVLSFVPQDTRTQYKYPEAAFWVSAAPFAGAEKIKWQRNHGQIVYADRVVINPAMATSVTHDVVSDMIVEDAIGREVEALRIKIEKQSLVATSMQECNLQIVDTDNDYFYFEVDIPDEAALREQEFIEQQKREYPLINLYSMTKSDWNSIFEMIPLIERIEKIDPAETFTDHGGRRTRPLKYVRYKSASVQLIGQTFALLKPFDWEDWEEGKKILKEQSFDGLDLQTTCKLLTILLYYKEIPGELSSLGIPCRARDLEDGRVLKLLKQLKINIEQEIEKECKKYHA